jgi:hypothetical protein
VHWASQQRQRNSAHVSLPTAQRLRNSPEIPYAPFPSLLYGLLTVALSSSATVTNASLTAPIYNLTQAGKAISFHVVIDVDRYTNTYLGATHQLRRDRDRTLHEADSFLHADEAKTSSIDRRLRIEPRTGI